jgi:hypothetical protein
MKVIEMKNRALLVGLAALLLVTLAYSSRSTAASTTSPVVKATQNAALDFELVNATGYDIKELYIGESGTGEWDKEDEISEGKIFKNGTELKIEFHPKEKHEKWDLMVSWADGSGKVEWLNLKLTEITKITLHYDHATNKTSATVE